LLLLLLLLLPQEHRRVQQAAAAAAAAAASSSKGLLGSRGLDRDAAALERQQRAAAAAAESARILKEEQAKDADWRSAMMRQVAQVSLEAPFVQSTCLHHARQQPCVETAQHMQCSTPSVQEKQASVGQHAPHPASRCSRQVCEFCCLAVSFFASAGDLQSRLTFRFCISVFL